MLLWFGRSLRAFVFNREISYFSDVWERRTYDYLPDSSWSLSSLLPGVIQKWYTVKRQVAGGEGCGRDGRNGRGSEAERDITSYHWELVIKKPSTLSTVFTKLSSHFYRIHLFFQQSYFSFLQVQLHSFHAFYLTNWGAVTRNIIRPKRQNSHFHVN